MDFYNNKKGREIAKKIKAAGGSEEDLKQAVKEAMESGELVLTPFDPRRTLDEHGNWEKAKEESEQLMRDEMKRELGEISQSDMSATDKQAARRKLDEKYKEYQRQFKKVVEKEEGKKAASGNESGGGSVQVKGYSRSTGEVKSHSRTWPDGDPSNNLSRK